MNLLREWTVELFISIPWVPCWDTGKEEEALRYLCKASPVCTEVRGSSSNLNWVLPLPSSNTLNCTTLFLIPTTGLLHMLRPVSGMPPPSSAYVVPLHPSSLSLIVTSSERTYLPDCASVNEPSPMIDALSSLFVSCRIFVKLYNNWMCLFLVWPPPINLIRAETQSMESLAPGSVSGTE